MGKWQDLTAQQKAQVIKFAIQNGVSNIKDIRDTFTMYSNEENVHKYDGNTEKSSKLNIKDKFNDWVKGAVYTGMSQRAGTDRDIIDAFMAAIQPNKNGRYSGSMGEDGWPNWDRNLINLYLNKDASSFEEISPNDLRYKGGHDYTQFLQQHNKNQDIKTYKGDLAIGLEPKVSPAIYQLAQDMGKQGVHTNRNMDLDMLLHYNDYGLNVDRGVSKDDWEYHMQPGEYVDDTRHFKRYYTNVDGKPIIQASKLWDFTPHGNMDIKEKIKSQLLTKYGTPFILRDAQELQQSNENTLDNRVYNTSILEDAINNKVVINNQDGTVSPLISLPEIEVIPSSSDWVFYSKDYEDSAYEKPILSNTAKGKVDSSNKKVVHSVFNSTPLVGHYITQKQLDSYPYTEYTTLYDEANGIQYRKGGPLTHKKSTGGPLYPFSFEKNPFMKTPVVRYDEGGEITNINLPEFTVMPRDSFVTYTGEETVTPTQEQFIKSKQDEARVLAGHKILKQPVPLVPKIPNQNKLSKALGYLGVSDNTRIKLFGDEDGASCIYTATGMYPKENQVSGTLTFAKDPDKYGFIPVQNGKFGDIGLFERHGTVVTGFNENREPVLSYSRGIAAPDPTAMAYDQDNWKPYGPHSLYNLGPLTYYRFIGTPEQQREWTNLYNTLYSK